MEEDDTWSISASAESTACVNPIRALVDLNVYVANPEKPVLRLNIGDPSYFGNLPASPIALQAVCDAVLSGKNNSYGATSGHPVAKKAIAEKFSYPDNPISEDDVFVTVGCSQAIEMTVTSLCDPGTNILMSRPGYPLYHTFCNSRQVEYRLFNLLPERSWEVDIAHMESLINEKTRVIVLVNPSNPCGSSYSKKHLLEIVEVAARHHLPILADEVYGDIVYNGGEFFPLASLTNKVPILVSRSLAKKYLTPGWRLGWLIVYDQHHRLDAVRTGILRLTMKIMGTCALIQAALPRILNDIPQEFFDNTNKHLETTSRIMYDRLSATPCLKPIKPVGSMYMLVGIDVDKLQGMKDDHDFTRQLMAEESVFLLPASLFSYPNYFRIVLLAPPEMMQDAADRIAAFCSRHLRQE